MTAPDVTLRPYEEYLDLNADAWDRGLEGVEPFQLYENLLGPDQRLTLFALVAALVATRRVTRLRQLHAGYTALHVAVGDAPVEEPADWEPGRRLDQPFRSEEPASLYALRALAALGLALAEDEPDPGLLHAALTWQREALATPAGGTVPWTATELAGDDPPLRRCLERLTEAAGADRNTLATLTAAVTLRRLRRPAVRPRLESLLSDPTLAAGGHEPARSWHPGRLPGLARRPRQHAITALLDEGSTGTAAKLTLIVDLRLPPGLIPDPERMSLLTADSGFRDALGRAWQQAGQGRIDGLVTWSALTTAGPVRYVGGGSAGAALAVILDEARKLARPLGTLTTVRRVVSSNAVIGRIDSSGYLQSVEGYAAKLGALRESSRVIVPAADAERAEQARAGLEGIDPQIVPVADWREAARRARATNSRVLLGRGLTLALVAALIATGVVAIVQRMTNDATASVAASTKLAGISEGLDYTDPVTAAALAAAAWQASPTSQAEESLLTVLAQPLRAVITQGGPFSWAGFSPGRGTVLATAGKSLQLWNAATRRPLGSPMAVPGGINRAAFSPDGALLATADENGTTRLWNVATHRQIGAPLTASGSGAVNAVAFSPDGSVLATADGDGTARLWNVASGRQIGIALPAGDATAAGGQVMDVAFSPDGSLLATASLDGTARLWNVATHRQVGAVMTDGNALSGLREMRRVAFSPDGATLATVSAEGTVWLWSVSTQHKIGQAGVQGEFAVDIAFGQMSGVPGAMLVITDSDGTADLWNMVAGAEVTALDGQAAGSMTSVAVGPDGAVLATVSADGAVSLWDIALFHAVCPSLVPGTVMTGALSPDGLSLAVAGLDHTIRVWNLATGRQARPPITVSGTTGVAALAFSPDGQLLATADNDGTVQLWDLAARRQAGPAITVSGTTGVAALAFSPDGQLLATADNNGTVRLWDLAARRQAGPAIAVNDEVNELNFSPDGAILATVTAHDSARLWNVKTHRPASGFQALSGVDALAFSPDGATLATAGEDGKARLWNLATGHETGDPMVATALDRVTGVAFSPDGNLLATAGDDGSVRLWDVATGHEIGPAMEAGSTASGVQSVAFGTDGMTLADIGSSETATLWDVALPADLLSAVCSVAGQPLTQQEWGVYVQSTPYIRACQ